MFSLPCLTLSTHTEVIMTSLLLNPLDALGYWVSYVCLLWAGPAWQLTLSELCHLLAWISSHGPHLVPLIPLLSCAALWILFYDLWTVKWLLLHPWALFYFNPMPFPGISLPSQWHTCHLDLEDPYVDLELGSDFRGPGLSIRVPTPFFYLVFPENVIFFSEINS